MEKKIANRFIEYIFFSNFFMGLMSLGLNLETNIKIGVPLNELDYYLLISSLTIMFYLFAYKIPYEDIVYLEGLDDYVKIHLEDGKKITARISMKSILEKLPENLFVRVHRSFIVPIKKIKSIQNKVLYLDELEIPIGDTYRNLVSEKFKA